jgi:hypothetical protein
MVVEAAETEETGGRADAMAAPADGASAGKREPDAEAGAEEKKGSEGWAEESVGSVAVTVVGAPAGAPWCDAKKRRAAARSVGDSAERDVSTSESTVDMGSSEGASDMAQIHRKANNLTRQEEEKGEAKHQTINRTKGGRWWKMKL